MRLMNGRTHEQMDFFPRMSWEEDRHLTVPGSDQKLRRWGSVSKARRMLDNCDRKVIYSLIELGALRAYKLNPEAKNCHWRIDLLSVWDHKQKQMRARQVMVK